MPVSQKNLEFLARMLYYYCPGGAPTHQNDAMNMLDEAIEAIRPVWEGNGQSTEIDWNDPSAKISKYFKVREVTLDDPRRIPTSKDVEDNILSLARELDKLRELWGAPISTTSWYRPPTVNAEIGGVPNSQHINGSAADIYSPGKDIYAFEGWLDTNWTCALGYGAKKGFVHLDLRPGRLRWDY